VTYTIRASAHEGRFFSKVIRSIGKVLKDEQKETVTISTDQVGYRRDHSEYIGLDVSRSNEGKYDLVVTVTDMVTGDSVTKETYFWLRKPAD